MVDIHSHILPGIDDGAETESDSIQMAEAAMEQGITQIVATPHHKNRTYDNYRNAIRVNVDRLNNLFQANELPLEILPGQEVRIYGDMKEDIERGEIQTINDSNYLLIEFPADSIPHYATQLFYSLQMSGIQPIIAHPERNRDFLNDPDKLYEFVCNGVLTQVTAASVIGKFGKDIQTYTNRIIEANLTHFIASDAHNTTSRGFCLREAYDYVQTDFGIEATYMFKENSHLLINDQNVYRNEPQRIKEKKRFFGLF